ncbi:spiroplasma phage ORF1-like family protein, partial [Spiroplasma phoeniceum]|uniref:spiroplasma phage ORF1-like family protein n=1 Tax=Spiroplasma phoeniceum TaxID=47835 RepID=UPI003364E791
FYDVDKKQFLRELTNFIYSFTIKYNLTQMLNKLKTNINDLQIVNLKNKYWKNILRTQAPNKEFLTATNKWYFYISKKSNEYITEKIYFDNNFINNQNTWWQHLKNDSNFIWNYNSVYRWDGDGNPKLPEIDKNTGKILKWNEKTD